MKHFVVASFTDAWIETGPRCNHGRAEVSHLLQMRGLKLTDLMQLEQREESHLLQMRGLKLIFGRQNPYSALVASFTDAWIETYKIINLKDWGLGRIFYRCVD